MIWYVFHSLIHSKERKRRCQTHSLSVNLNCIELRRITLKFNLPNVQSMTSKCSRQEEMVHDTPLRAMLQRLEDSKRHFTGHGFLMDFSKKIQSQLPSSSTSLSDPSTEATNILFFPFILRVSDDLAAAGICLAASGFLSSNNL